jgi:hypothetical protein
MQRINERLHEHALLLETVADIRRQLTGKLAKKDRRMLSAVEAGKLAASAKLEAEINFLRTELLSIQLRQMPTACSRCRVGRVNVRVEDELGREEWLCNPCADVERQKQFAFLPPPPPTGLTAPGARSAVAGVRPNPAAPATPPVAAQQPQLERRISSMISGVQGLKVDLSKRPVLCEQCSSEPPTALVRLLANNQSLFTCQSCAADITERLARNMPLAPRGKRPPPLPPIDKDGPPSPVASPPLPAVGKRLPPVPNTRPAPPQPLPRDAPAPPQPVPQFPAVPPAHAELSDVVGILSSRRQGSSEAGSGDYEVHDWASQRKQQQQQQQQQPPPPLPPLPSLDSTDDYQALPISTDDGYAPLPIDQVGQAALPRARPPTLQGPLRTGVSVPQFMPIAAPAEVQQRPSRPTILHAVVQPAQPAPVMQPPPAARPGAARAMPAPVYNAAPLRQQQQQLQQQQQQQQQQQVRGAQPGGIVVQGGETVPARLIAEQSTGYTWARVRAPNSGPLIFVPEQLRNGAVDGDVVLLKVKMSTTKSAGKLYGRVVLVIN